MMKAAIYEKDTRKAMENMGTYAAEYDPIIKIYANMLEEMDTFLEDTSIDPRRKEILRKDIITYSNSLLLNPKSRDTVDIKISEPSSLEKALMNIG